MRIVLVFFFSTLICHGQSIDTTVVRLHPRIGVVIDSLERVYFDLFPTVAGFREATLHRVDDRLHEFSISDSMHVVSNVVVSSNEILLLRKYIARYEDPSLDVDDYQLLIENGIIGRRPRRFFEPPMVTILHDSDRVTHEYLLCTVGDSIVYSVIDYPYKWYESTVTRYDARSHSQILRYDRSFHLLAALISGTATACIVAWQLHASGFGMHGANSNFAIPLTFAEDLPYGILPGIAAFIAGGLIFGEANTKTIIYFDSSEPQASHIPHSMLVSPGTVPLEIQKRK